MKIGCNEIFIQDTGGDKPALLFVHGIMMDHTVWRHQVNAFGDTHRVVCVDLRGHGQSKAASPEISFEDHVEDLLAVIDDLSLNKVTLIGWSMGGAIAQVLCANNPNAVKHLVLVGSTPQLLADSNFPHALPVEAAMQLGGLLVENFGSGCEAFCGMISPEDPIVSEALTGIASATHQDVAMSAFQSSGARTQLADLPKISTSTTVICGTEDAICLPAASDYLADAIPGCINGAVKIEGAGHAPFLTKSETFNHALKVALA